MSALSWAAAGLGAASALLVLAPRTGLAPAPAVESPGPERAVLRRLRPLLALVAAAGGWALVGGGLGVAAAVVCASVVWFVLGRGEDPAVVRRRERLREDLPLGVDLLGACLDAGAAPEAALEPVARAVGGPVADELLGLHHLLRVGVDPVQVWRSLLSHPELAPLGRAISRAHESGASVSRAIHQLSAELRERQQGEVERRARSIEVRAAAPLGLCLLPAFVLLGVVPMVAGVFGSMRVFG